MSGTRVPPNFDPYTQNITLLDKDGDSFTVSMRDFDMYRLYASRLAINYASQIGASLILLLVLLLLTRAEKRKSFIFIINAFSLASNTIRCILLCCYLTGNRYHPYSQISGDWSHVTRSDFAVAISSDILTLLVTALVFVSLILQIWVVCITTPAVQRNIIMATTSSVACVALGFKVALFFHNTRQLLAYQGMEACKTLIGVTYVLQGVALCLFSCVFTFKLGYAVVQRRRLNMPQFGPMQIVFIMGCQTMLVPGMLQLNWIIIA
jgi:pheromone alpha factor receptor